MPETKRKLKRRVAFVEYTDGRVEEYNLGKPIYEYQVKKLGIDPATDQTEAGFFTLWFAAGKPGANGSPLTIESATPLLEAWLETIENTDFDEVDAAPPTKRRAASPTSPA
jgi:hypothetical protein